MPDIEGRPIRLRASRRKGYRHPEGAVFVSRPTKWGNPYRVDQRPPHWPADQPWGREQAVACFRLMVAGGHMLGRDPGHKIVIEAQMELAGKDLICWCPLDEPCHADVLLQYANAEYEDYANGTF